MKTATRVLFGMILGAVLGGAGVWWIAGSSMGPVESAAGDHDTKGREPLYWVAPMNPDYRRDKPGKSPMGMDLVPVYEEETGGEAPGTVRIDPAIVNNLGVRTAPAELGRLRPEVITVGSVNYDERRLVQVSPRVEGWVEKLHVKAAGDPVSRGEPLYTLYSPTLVNAQEELLLALKRGNPVLVDSAVKRLEALDVSRAAIDRLRETRQVSQTIRFNAPQSGVVDNLHVREGLYIKPGMSLMTLGQPEHIWVIGEVFERQVNLVKPGDPVRMRLDFIPGREWTGEVDYVYPSLDPQTHTARVRVHFINPDRVLKPGMFAQMTIQTEPGPETLLIPREALIRTGRQNRVVLALGEGRFKSVAVEVGQVGIDQVEVRSGLREGDRVVTSAQFLIDSESSKTSDFKRMSPDAPEDGQVPRPMDHKAPDDGLAPGQEPRHD